jgi:hypothetical protein
MSQEVELFLVKAVRTSDPAKIQIQILYVLQENLTGKQSPQI